MASALTRVTANWQLKLLALVLAMLLWVGVSAEQPAARWLPVTFRVVLQDADYQLNDASVPEEVEVLFAAPGRVLWELAVSEPELVLRISEVDEETQTFVLSPQMVNATVGRTAQALDVRPNTVRLRFQRFATRELPVQLNVRGLRPGYSVVGRPSVNPEAVRVSGPARQLADLAAVETEPLDLSAVDSTFAESVELNLAPLRGLRVTRETVEVKGRLDRVADRTLSDVLVEVGPGIALVPRTVTVRLRGAETALRGILPGTLRVVVAIDSIPAQIAPSGVPVPLRVERLPPGVTAVVSPATARLLPPARPPQLEEPAAPSPALDTLPLPAPMHR